jgi:D-alanyl-D-alanine carboxypeptidase/D-alanyl-D-alanine-endopeptidase (penicillin-binding protein 4)
MNIARTRISISISALVFVLVAPGPAASAPGHISKASARAQGCAPLRYRVRAGDTLSSIARRFHTSDGALAQANSLDPNAILPVGKVLHVPAACEHFRASPSSGAGGASTLTAAMERAVAVPGVARARTGVVVLDLASNSVVYELNPELPLKPASTEKLPVAVTALQRLGPGFRTYTAVLASGSLTGTTWSGDLVLKGYGDPTLNTAGLDALARAVRARGITTVAGGVVGDETYFDTLRTAPGWKPSFAKDESPLLSALVVNRGLLDGTAVDHPALAAAILFTRSLKRAGVTVGAAPRTGIAPEAAVQLARRASPPLSVLLAQMDTWSDNFIAEMLLKQLGSRLNGGGTTSAGAAAVANVLAGDEIPLGGSRLADGSGLSSFDRLTARMLAATLQTVWHEPSLRRLLGTLAIAGQTGTLRHRLLDVPSHALVRGKTGTTDEASALAAFVASRYAFVVLCNGSPVNWQAAHLLQDRVAEALLSAR